MSLKYWIGSSLLAAEQVAHAAGTPGTAQGSMSSSLLFMLLIGLVFYFLIIRPQQTRARNQKALTQGLQVDDEVVTIGGIHGRIAWIDEQQMGLTVAQSVVITMKRDAVATQLPKGSLDQAK